jgi:ectoine hydroxylase-related dioxygenase (phytanoyl-CoA dioxygenase family)
VSHYRIHEDGFESIPQVLDSEECEHLIDCLAGFEGQSAGTRSLLRYDWCKTLVSRLRQHPRIVGIIPADYRAVQCTYFEKSTSRNWLVPIHQDLSIPVASRVPHADLRGWSEKEGELFVQPPESLLEQLLAIRVHLDACSKDDGPLQFVPRTHLLGRLSAQAARELRQSGPVVTCVHEQGDALALRPLTLHTSAKATGTSKRRVLHILFGPSELPFGLRWPNPQSEQS